VKRFLLVPLLLAVACKPPTPAEQLETMASWIATARMVGDAWLRRTTPDTYTQQTLELSDQMLLETGKQLLESPPPSIDSATLDTVLARTRFQIKEMARRIREKAAPEFRQPWDSLAIYEKIVKQMSDKVESSQ
jgi:hypothetical protein